MTAWVTGFTPTASRTDALAWAGGRFTTGPGAVTVSALGRWVIAGSAGATHTVKLVLASTGADVAGASVTIDTTGAPSGAFKYVNLASPVTLAANTGYYLVSSETGTPELWLSAISDLATTAVAASTGTVFNTSPTGGTWTTGGAAGGEYVGLDFQYGSSDVTPPSVVSRVISAATLTITYDEALDPAFVPATSAYTVKVNGTARAVTNVAVSGSTVTLTLASPVTGGQTVTVSYNP